jgi:hypothetical protein
MATRTRAASETARQIEEFRAALPPNFDSPPPDDFAARLQSDAWKAHLAELRAELSAALKDEREGAGTSRPESREAAISREPPVGTHRPDARRSR